MKIPRSFNIFRHWKKFLPGLIILLVLFFFFGPSLIFNLWLNQDFAEGQFFSRMSASKGRISPLFDEVTVSGLTLYHHEDYKTPLTIQEIRGTNLHKISLLKVIFGLAEERDFVRLLSDGDLVVRDFSYNNEFVFLKKLTIGAINLAGLDYEGDNALNLNNQIFKNLKILDFAVTSLNGETLNFDGLSLSDYRLGLLKNLTISGLTYLDSQKNGLSLGDLEGKDINFTTFTYTPQTGTAGSLQTLLKATKSLNIHNFQQFLWGESILSFVDLLHVHARPEASTLVASKITVKDLRAKLEDLWPQLNLTPVGRVFLASFQPEIQGNLTIDLVEPTRQNMGTVALSLQSPQGIDLNFSLEFQNFWPLGLKSLDEVALKFLNSQIGKGRFSLKGSDLSQIFYPPLATEFFDGQNPAEELPRYLAPLYEKWATGLLSNPQLIQEELSLFFQNPQSLEIQIDPVKNFPRSSLEKAQKMSAGSILTDPQNFVRALNYAIINDISLSFSINGRAYQTITTIESF
ncbi:MAG: hypothetical protein LBF22_08335 [Deltaproteobacteria bacterium]|jgi:hypothetical protein|nr:hypothetical protein [Deltaproteobacteria bacterium]